MNVSMTVRQARALATLAKVGYRQAVDGTPRDPGYLALAELGLRIALVVEERATLETRQEMPVFVDEVGIRVPRCAYAEGQARCLLPDGHRGGAHKLQLASLYGKFECEIVASGSVGSGTVSPVPADEAPPRVRQPGHVANCTCAGCLAISAGYASPPPCPCCERTVHDSDDCACPAWCPNA